MVIAHIGDLHLGFRQYMLLERYKDFERSYINVINQILDIHPDILIISGDVFHSKRPDWGSIKLFQDTMCELKRENIEVVAITGNHCHSRPTWHEFFNLRNTFENDVIKVNGINWCSNPVQSLLEAETSPNKFNIAIIHQGIKEYYGIIHEDDVNKIKQLGYDYVALGHIHVPYVIDNLLFNPGSLEYTSSSLWGRPGGYFVIELGNNEFNYRHIESIHRPAYKINMEVDRSLSYEDLLRKVKFKVHGISNNSIVEIILSGYPRQDSTVINKVEDNLSSLFLRLRIKNNTNQTKQQFTNSKNIQTEIDIYKQVFGNFYDKAVKVIGISDDVNAVVQEL